MFETSVGVGISAVGWGGGFYIVFVELTKLVKGSDVVSGWSATWWAEDLDEVVGVWLGAKPMRWSVSVWLGHGCWFLVVDLWVVGWVEMENKGFSTGVGAFVGDKRNILDYHRRQLAAKHELKRKLYKAMWRDSDLPSNMREKARYKLSKLPRNSAFNRLRNRCIFTGRPRAVYEKFRMSRIVFRELASKGELLGVKKASW
ncbi:hypothetical protein KSS87_002088 [Heliosperma pusillum]|nr:hypothetical protein KSS87_002088 [Heliosperma pusillum]